jgi:hypothetical protein
VSIRYQAERLKSYEAGGAHIAAPLRQIRPGKITAHIRRGPVVLGRRSQVTICRHQFSFITY